MAPGQLFQDGEQSFLESGPVGALRDATTSPIRVATCIISSIR